VRVNLYLPIIFGGLWLYGILNFSWSYSLVEEPRLVARADYSLGVVFLEKWRGDNYLGIEQILPIEEYFSYSIKEAVITAWQERAQRMMQQRELATEPAGLIPDIKFPRLPIFGEGSKIDISGKDRITLGGSRTVVKGATRTLGSQSLFPELKMEQQLAVNVNGTIGDRTKITIDHDSEREEQQNKIKLQYTGTEDDIVQSLELGDTKLYIPGSIYTGDLPAYQGLFGISAKAKFAGADVYALASREGSQTQTQSFSGHRRVTIDTIWDTDFVLRRFHRLPDVDSSERLSNLRVYVDDKNSGNNQATIKAIATVFPDYPDSIVGDNTWWSYDRTGGDFDLKIPGVDYLLQPGNIIEFLTPIERNYVVGVVIFKENDTIGGQILRDSLVLCLIKPEVSDSLSRTWDLQLRNYYQLRQNDVRLDSIRIFRYNPQGQHYDYETDSLSSYRGFSFLRILGLDPDGDGRIEYPAFESKTGIIRFPLLKPFASPLLSEKDDIIYRFDPEYLPPGTGRKYFLVVSYYTVTETYYLGQTDILEGSERVLVNGQQKTKGVDYSIDYKTGIITFLKPLPPDADIKVTFEYQPWFSLTQKSLVGVRSEWAFSSNGKIGTSFFYRSEGIPEEKPLLGSEPFQRMITEADISYSASSDEVTAFLDQLPLITAQSPSRFNFKTEGAISVPNPNTRGVAYLDDFEATVISRDISNTGLLWSYASVPIGKDTNNFARSPIKWFNPKERVRKDSVFGPGIGDEGRETQDILKIIFIPDSGNEQSWAGIMQAPAGQLGMNFAEIENMELVVRSRERNGNIHITIGMAIDEDAPRRGKDGKIKGYNGYLDGEDLNGNGVLDEDEDTGLDGLYGADSLWTNDSGDDGNDDYDPVNNQQGTEGNRRLDSEDIDRNGFSRYNHYFEYTISLSETKYMTELFNGWKLYRLSLRDSMLFHKVGNPKWEDMRIVRIWLDGYDDTDTLEIYSLQFLGSKWRNPRIENITPSNSVPVDTNEKIWIAQVSKKTDPNYSSPFDLKKDIAGKIETEASLLLGYQMLYKNRQAWVTKTVATGEDYRDYEELRFYIHDDGNGLQCFIRLGSDSVNYYEFRAPITAGRSIIGRDGKWFEFLIALDSFPRLKFIRDSLGIRPESSFTLSQNTISYSVKGLPSLANIRWSALGIANPNRDKITGGVWFNDIRLASPRRDAGYGFTAQTAIQLADLLMLDLRWSYSDPNFRRFSEDRGVKVGGFSRDLGAGVRLNLDRFLPPIWKVSIPLSYYRTQRVTTPKYSPFFPDLRTDNQIHSALTGSGHSQEISIDNLSKQKSNNKLLNYTLEAMSFSIRQRWAGNRFYPFYDSSNNTLWQWRYGIRPELKIPLKGDNELYPLPRDISISITRGSRTEIRGDTVRVDTTRGKGVNGNIDIGFSLIENLSLDYNWDSERDLLANNPDTVVSLPIGKESGRNESFSITFEPEVGDILNPTIEFDGDYNHDLPKAGNNYADYRNISNSGEISVNATIDFAELSDIISFGRKHSDKGQKNQLQQSRLRSLGENPPPPETKLFEDSSIVNSESIPLPAGAKIPAIDLATIITEITRNIEPLEVSYSLSRTSDYLGIKGAAPWGYRLGITDTFVIDTTSGRVNRTRDLNNTWRISSGFGFKELTARFGYDYSWGKSREILGATAERTLTWPKVDLSLGKIHNLFRNWATDSRLTSSYRQNQGLRAELLPVANGAAETLAVFGRTANRTIEFNPLLSWQTNWKKRVSTTFGINYTHTSNLTYLSPTGRTRSVTETRSQGLNTSLSYSFSAPKGLKLPFLKNIRFSQDLSLTWQFRYSQTVRQQTVWNENGEANTVPQQKDNTAGTTLGASYRFSRTIEGGLNTGYTFNKGISGISNERTDLDIWILFRF